MSKNISGWLKKILPDNFADKQAEFLQMEAFLQHYFKADIYAQMQLMSCSSNRVVIAAKSPQVAGYIKLQQADLEQQMDLQLSQPYRLLIKTNPRSLQKKPINQSVAKVKRSKAAEQALMHMSESIEDEALKHSLAQLAHSMKQRKS